jgi:hypothetical protein
MRIFSRSRLFCLRPNFFQKRPYSELFDQNQISEYQAALSVTDPDTIELMINKGFALLAMHQPILLMEANYNFVMADKFLMAEKRSLDEKTFNRYRKYIDRGFKYLEEYSNTKKFPELNELPYIDTLFTTVSTRINRD